MGGITPVLQLLPVISQGVGLVSNIVSSESAVRDQRAGQDLALQQLQQRQAEQQRQSREDAALDRERIAADADASERKRRDALRRAVSRQRAQFGGSGISSSGGSAEAVLLGLFEETDNEREERERLDNLRFGAIDQNLSQQRRLNVIQRTQLQESQRIGRLSSGVNQNINRINSGLDVLSFAGNLF
ncbi:MAG: hypothetical protein DHS20C02_00190 [Micavibrio sp.]|nr:MAG: hypothetical protein DHS20C02_00190 [Micavibrio sp.]